jgi:hypothetical protein
MSELPPIAPAVLAEVLAALPPRLRRRLDAAVPGADAWAVELGEDTAVVHLEESTLTWRLHGGLLTSGADLACDCLLSPKCLHRAIAVAAAEVGEADISETAAAPGPEAAEREPGRVEVTASPAELDAARALALAGGRILHAGVTGSGTMTRAELLRAVHAARIAGLHRPAATGLRIAAALVAANTGDPAFTRGELTSDLTELLLTCHDLIEGVGEVTDLRGVARREYRPIGGLRLTGLCTEPVLTSNGYGGVVTHLVDTEGELWNIPAITPGGVERIRAAASGPVAVGESGLSHEALSRKGLLLSSGTASADRRLGTGAGVRAVAASEAAWTEEPLAALWRVPLSRQVARVFAAADKPDGLRPSGDGLVFLTARVLGTAGPALRVRAGGEAGDRTVHLLGADTTVADNLRLLAGLPGAELLVVARPHTDRPATATALAISADPEVLRLPAAWGGRVNLGLDRLQRSFLVNTESPRALATGECGRAPIQLLEHWAERVVIGGRSIAVVASAEADRARLRRLGLAGTARILGELSAAARDQHRDAFGRLITADDAAFPRAWMRAGEYLRAFHRHTTRHSWDAEE